MNTNYIISLFLVLSSVLSAQTKMLYHRATIQLEGKNIAQLAELGVETDHGDYKPGRSFTSDFSEFELNLIRQAGFSTQILIENVADWYASDQNKSSALPRNACGASSQFYNYPTPVNYTTGTMAGYFTYQEMLDILDDMHQKFPNLISPRKITSDTIVTHEGRPQYWVKVSDNPSNDENEPKALFTALHHSREPNSMSQMIFFLWYLLENYDNDPEIKYIVDNTELFFVPCVNPDGYLYNEATNPDGGGLWRKNRRDNGDGTFGVDLNRNYGYEWGFNNQGSSPNTSSELYRGPSAFSEPESRMLRDFCRAHSFKMALNYHTYSNLLIYPWGYSDFLANDSFTHLSKLLTQENRYKAGTASETVGYLVNGTSDDWMYGDEQIFSMTPEVGPVAWGFWPPADEIDFLNKSALKQNLLTAKILLNFGTVSDQSSETYNSTSVQIPYSVQRFGFEDGPLTVSLSPLTDNIQAVSGPKDFSLNQFETTTDEFEVTLKPSILIGEQFKLLLTISNGIVSQSDTLVKYYGYNTASILTDNADNLNNWTGTWGISNTIYLSAPGSITDSPDGDYPDNALNLMVSNQPVSIPSDATDANLKFFARWSIEQDWDYVQVSASEDQNNWVPLCGRYTNPGVLLQPIDEPIFDGLQSEWVQESLDLSDYIGKTIWIRFQLVSDGFQQYDGFYFDDLGVEYNSITSSAQNLAVNGFSIAQNRPNPAQSSTTIEWGNQGQTLKEGKLNITNALGNIVFSRDLNLMEQSNIQIDTEKWPSGTYFYQIITKTGKSAVKKIIVK